MSPVQIFTKLVGMRNEAGSTLHERLKLAKQLLADRGWVDAVEHGGGNESIALDRLEEECFGDVCGGMSLSQILEILEAVPQASAWKANKYNLRRMYAEMKARQDKTKPKEAKPESIRDRRDVMIEDLKAKLTEARQRIHDLEGENRTLRSQVKRIQAVIGITEEAA